MPKDLSEVKSPLFHPYPHLSEFHDTYQSHDESRQLISLYYPSIPEMQPRDIQMFVCILKLERQLDRPAQARWPKNFQALDKHHNEIPWHDFKTKSIDEC